MQVQEIVTEETAPFMVDAYLGANGILYCLADGSKLGTWHYQGFVGAIGYSAVEVSACIGHVAYLGIMSPRSNTVSLHKVYGY